MLSGGGLECQMSARSQFLIYKPQGKVYGWMVGTSLLLLRKALVVLDVARCWDGFLLMFPWYFLHFVLTSELLPKPELLFV